MSATTESQVAAITFAIAIIKDQISRTDDPSAKAFLSQRLSYFENVVSEMNAGQKASASHAELSSVYNLVSSYHNARTTTTPYDAQAGEHFYNASVETLREDLTDMVRAAEEA
jgi:alpha/beta superfamily hydrolase